MKKFSKLIVTLSAVFAMSASLFAFDWSSCWKTYGGGIKKGDMIIDVDLGLGSNFFYPFTDGRDGKWAMPNVTATFEVAQPIWVLPFTFGGYVGIGGYGYGNKYWENRNCDGCGAWGNTHVDKLSNHFRLQVGGTIAYHIALPPEKLDVYARVKLGCDFDFYNHKYDCNHPDGNGGNHKYTDKNSGMHANFAFGTTLGASYYFTDNFGAHVEVGFNIWSGLPGLDLTAGASFKF